MLCQYNCIDKITDPSKDIVFFHHETADSSIAQEDLALILPLRLCK